MPSMPIAFPDQLPERVARLEERVDGSEHRQDRYEKESADNRALLLKTLLAAIGGLLTTLVTLVIVLLRKA